MTDPLETLLRETFEAEAALAPPASGLARDARTRLRRRRVRIAGGLTTVAAVAVIGGAALDAARPEPSRGAPAGTVDVAPQPTTPPVAGAEPPYLPAEERQIAPLRRPLRLPTVAPGAACPVSPGRELPAGGGFNTPFTVLGTAPFGLTGPPEVIARAPEPGSAELEGWLDGKVIWAVEGEYPGPVVVRGGRVDGTGELRLVRYLGALGQAPGSAGFAELAYPGQPGGELVTYPSGVQVRQPGCYAVQVDGTSFSEVIVFRVTAG